ncbi:5090_t:CDS:2, partial [Cetraspora pellucida]
ESSKEINEKEINKYSGACGISPGLIFFYGVPLTAPTPFECKGTCLKFLTVLTLDLMSGYWQVKIKEKENLYKQ